MVPTWDTPREMARWDTLSGSAQPRRSQGGPWLGGGGCDAHGGCGVGWGVLPFGQFRRLGSHTDRVRTLVGHQWWGANAWCPCTVDKICGRQKLKREIFLAKCWFWEVNNLVKFRNWPLLSTFYHVSSGFAHAFHWGNWTGSGDFALKMLSRISICPHVCIFCHFRAFWTAFFSFFFWLRLHRRACGNPTPVRKIQ